MKYAKEFGYTGHMLPILINYMVIHHTLTYWGIILSMIKLIHTTFSPTYPSDETYYIHRYIDNGSDNTVGGSYYSAHQAVDEFVEHHIDMVSCVHRKCQTREGVSGDVNKMLECVTITDSMFSNRVLEWMTPKCTSINGVTIRLEQLNFCFNRCKWEFPDEHVANCILPPELFFNIFISTVCSHDMSYRQRNSSAKLSSSFPSLTLVENRPYDCFGRTSIHTVFVVLYTMSWGPAYARDASKSVQRAVTVGASNTISEFTQAPPT